MLLLLLEGFYKFLGYFCKASDCKGITTCFIYVVDHKRADWENESSQMKVYVLNLINHIKFNKLVYVNKYFSSKY